MKFGTAVGPVFGIILLLAISGCGGGIPAQPASISPPLSPTPNGSWLLTGSNVTDNYPIISTALIVSGGQVIANGWLEAECGTMIGSQGFYLSGPIAPDGSFQLGVQPAPITITGVVPASGATAWSGTYDLGPGSCAPPQGASFTAAVLPPFNATYAGALQGGTTSGQSITVTFSQGVATSVANGSFTYEYLPLSMTVTISGSPCFAHGTSAAGLALTNPSAASGAGLYGTEVMDNGSQLVFLGAFTVPDESSVSLGLAAPNGACNGSNYYATLTRQ